MNPQPSVENPLSAGEILHGALELITDPSHFCQGSFALNKNGDTVTAVADDACRWCAFGAIEKVGRGGRNVEVARSVLTDATLILFRVSFPTDLNDSEHGHARILAALTYAIEIAPLLLADPPAAFIRRPAGAPNLSEALIRATPAKPQPSVDET